MHAVISLALLCFCFATCGADFFDFLRVFDIFNIFKKDDSYQIGVGIHDITGPCAGVKFWGFGTMDQSGAGIHLRQFSRAFIFEKGGVRVVHVTLDIGAVSEVVKTKVMEKLAEKYGSLYTAENVVITATNTYSAPGGYFYYMAYSVFSLGFVRESYDAAVLGTFNSILLAHENLQKGYLYINSGTLHDCNINRSPMAYENNMWMEKLRYFFNVDKTMTVLKVTDAKYKPLGAIVWFPVKANNMNGHNNLVSSDNKGYAAYLFEKAMNGKESLPGTGKFVASFPQSSSGDSTPYIGGFKCTKTGKPCDSLTKTCGNGTCVAVEPGQNGFESVQIIGRKMAQKAKDLYFGSNEQISGDIQFIHQRVNMTHIGTSGLFSIFDFGEFTCPTAYGNSFLAGTSVAGDHFQFIPKGLFQEGLTTKPPDFLKEAIDIILEIADEVLSGKATLESVIGAVFDEIRGGFSFGNILGMGINFFTGNPPKKVVECQKPKPIVFAFDQITMFSNHWAPQTVPTQLLKIGQLMIAPVPAEFTTMSGRRMQEKLQQCYRFNNWLGAELTVIVQSLSNGYSSYVTTKEEYEVQEYEGASTLYGPNTLDAYLNQYDKLCSNMFAKQKLPAGAVSPQLEATPFTMASNFYMDSPGFFTSYGQVMQDARSYYSPGESVSVTFQSAHPKNNLRLGSTYLSVDRLVNGVGWKIISTDADWDTKYYWEQDNILLGTSMSTVVWTIPSDIIGGTYRIRHFGTDRSNKNFEGISKSFLVGEVGTPVAKATT